MSNFNQLIQQHFGPLSVEDLNTIRKYFREEKLLKNEFFTKSDLVCNRLSMVKSGILRSYALSDGKEITQWLSVPDSFITEAVGFFFNQPNRWNIQAFTEVELLTITKTDYQKLCKEFPKWNEIEKQFIIKCFMMMEDRIFSHLSMTAEERYNRYFDHQKELFTQVPFQYIASVLGMTPETFSRIRKRQAEKS
ncbi:MULTISPECIES: Crp/Fnr family transcriptional regulator [Chryseobacterium]|uniref:CRP-like cAMP-binding protein n=1 Tax=Chryseobacterium camelliae TaxID=1265445 RepID=A0ABU0TGY8_9FLAO|nr:MULTISPECIES: Crp/Fnr family transcriptional regulator [Chryseobacterium]MDT3406107.1 CRP-like cAMP-binding protein [Pseudacidovorax intermedius]MDQ1096091.1 CRP-like cAMP-binding protein [Chryseobacterium camelliae]MDQ1100027.1 CRP-like cAMP-binding protein [Chryseobacterium sp. SORGH_AS_1048]MDR6087371.1 CRP-like cAMP-binding protein [Chryseobacterium sp. SORGH_AS_0909]MDR6131746.1 CRP-like cAMP-binding protein [Chryseobacterium sp. SORGH_AS_1175]